MKNGSPILKGQGREKIGLITIGAPAEQGAGQRLFTIYVDDDDTAYEVREEDIVRVGL